jgi:hypothetical protein
MEPLTPTSSVIPGRNPRKEHNSSLRNAAPLLQLNKSRTGAMEAYTHAKQTPVNLVATLLTQALQ